MIYSYPLSKLKTKIKWNSILRDPNFTKYDEPSIVEAINVAQNEIVLMHDFSFREKTDNVILTPWSNSFILPLDFDYSNPNKLTIYLDSVNDQNKLEYLFWRENPDSTKTWNPIVWWEFWGVWYVYPIPIIANTLIMQYYRIPDELTSNESISIIPHAYADILAWKVWVDLLPASDTNFQKCQVTYQEKLNNLCDQFLWNRQENKQWQVFISDVNW